MSRDRPAAMVPVEFLIVQDASRHDCRGPKWPLQAARCTRTVMARRRHVVGLRADGTVLRAESLSSELQGEQDMAAYDADRAEAGKDRPAPQEMLHRVIEHLVLLVLEHVAVDGLRDLGDVHL